MFPQRPSPKMGPFKKGVTPGRNLGEKKGFAHKGALKRSPQALLKIEWDPSQRFRKLGSTPPV